MGSCEPRPSARSGTCQLSWPQVTPMTLGLWRTLAIPGFQSTIMPANSCALGDPWGSKLPASSHRFRLLAQSSIGSLPKHESPSRLLPTQDPISSQCLLASVTLGGSPGTRLLMGTHSPGKLPWLKLPNSLHEPCIQADIHESRLLTKTGTRPTTKDPGFQPIPASGWIPQTQALGLP